MLVRRIVVGQRIDHLEGAAVRLVVDAQPPLFLDGVALVVEILLGDRQRLHAIGLEEDAEIELVGGQRLEVERAVLVGGAVHRAAVDEHQHEVFAGADVLGSLEHHVLEEVREPGSALPFVTRADVVVHGDRIDRRGVVLGHDHPQAVGELGFRKANRRRCLCQRLSRGRQHYQQTDGHQSGAFHQALLGRMVGTPTGPNRAAGEYRIYTTDDNCHP